MVSGVDRMPRAASGSRARLHGRTSTLEQRTAQAAGSAGRGAHAEGTAMVANTSPDRAFVMLSALGSDQPGLVAQITKYVADRGGNVEDSRMVALGGVFGVMLLASGSAPEAEHIIADVAALERESGMRVLVHAASNPSAKGQHSETGVLLSVTASAFDREGILMEISDVMRSTGGNILELDTTTYDEPLTKAPYFQLRMTVEVGSVSEVEPIRAKLTTLAIRERIAMEVKLAERSVDRTPGLTVTA
jgi:glycine cleavage system transcriptional repressor